MSSPKKRPFSQAQGDWGPRPDSLNAKKARIQDQQSLNSVGTSLTDSSDDDHVSGGLGFGFTSSKPVTHGFIGGATRHTATDIQTDDHSKSELDTSGEIDRPMLGLGATTTSSSDDSDSESPDPDTMLSPHALRREPQQQGGSGYSKFASSMMEKMGFESGKGLGKNQQGRVNLVEASKHKGRRGLGHSIQGFEQTSVDWNFEHEEVRIEEHVTWIPSTDKASPSLDEMKTWFILGQKKRELEGETEFVSDKTLQDVLDCKTIFDNLEDEELRRARTRSNPYETIRGAFFQNRAAMKMANMDAMTGFMFTNPKDDRGQPLVRPDELLYFADVCAGPGGFTEYILWRKQCESKGFGFTLRGACDFKLEEFYAASSECFEPHYGVGALEGDGDVYRVDNQDVFRQFVWENTGGAGLHFVMADGGFSVEGQENIQEILSKRLYLCQFLVALSVLRVGGHFVCKLFDIFTPFSMGLVYLMYRAFTRISLIKPVTSRPANSERYIICQGMRDDAHRIHDYMKVVNAQLETTFSSMMSEEDVTDVVPIDLMKSDTDFYDYVYDSNEVMGKMQAQALVKIQTFAQNSTLHETRQAETRQALLKLWDVPDKLRTAPNKSEQPQSKFSKMTEGSGVDIGTRPVDLTPATLTTIHSVYDYRCILTAAEDRWFLLSLGKLQIWKWDGKAGSKWRKADEVRMELPRNTLIEAEFVQELRGEGRGQKKVMAVHVIDALVINGNNIQQLHYKERIQKVFRLVRAINRTSRPDLSPIRVKDSYKLEEIDKIFQKLSMKLVKGSGNRMRVCYQCNPFNSYTSSRQHHGEWQFQPTNEQPRYIIPMGLLIIKTEKDPWMLAFSRSQKRFYWYNTQTRESVFEYPKDCVGEYSYCLSKRLLWRWDVGVRLCEQQTRQDDDKLSRDQVCRYIHKLLPT